MTILVVILVVLAVGAVLTAVMARTLNWVTSTGPSLKDLVALQERVLAAQAAGPPVHLMTGSSSVRCGARMARVAGDGGWDLGTATVDRSRVTCPECLGRGGV